jgi:hypothetical protein
MKKAGILFVFFVIQIFMTSNKGFAQDTICEFDPENPLVITQNTLFNYNLSMDNDIIITPGYILTITGELAMVPESRIIIMPGAKLIVDGGTITTSCAGEFWKGIEVQGNTNLSQTEENQGYAIFKSNATIEYALSGAYTAILDEYGVDDPDGYGGVINADSTNFYNNFVSINIRYYFNIFNFFEQNNDSEIKNSTFEVDQNYYDEIETPPGFIMLTWVDGVDIFNNIFKNTYETSFLNKNVGIVSYDANYYVSEDNQFQTLQWGIRAFGTSPLLSPYVDYNDFSNCSYGIYMSGITNPTIIYNTIEVPEYYDHAYGLFISNCPTFNIQENSFSGYDSETGDFGIIINGCGENSKKIYNNTFSNLLYGTQSQGYNANTNRTTGLQILCNIFSDVNVDISVTGVPGVSEDGSIVQYQGSDGENCTYPAGNLFSLNTLDYWNGLEDNITYYHHDPDSKPEVLPTYDGNITLYNTDVNWIDKTTCCPSDAEEKNLLIDELKSKIINSQIEINNANSKLLTLIDGGNTSLLKMQVENSPPSQALQLRDNLLSKSPYLSDIVMISAIENEAGLPPAMLTQVLVANPSSAKSPVVIKKLLNRENPLPEYMLKQIMAGKHIVSDKEKLETTVSYYTLQRDVAFDKIERIYKNDKRYSWSKDSLINILKYDPRLSAKYELIFAYFKNGDINTAMQKLLALPKEFPLDENKMEEYNDYLVFYEIFSSLWQSNKTWQDMSNEQKKQLYILADKAKNQADIYAINVLRMTDNYKYIEPIIIPAKGKNLQFNGKQPEFQSLNSDIQLKVYPNPAGDYFVIDYRFSENSSGTLLEIKDLTGKIVRNFVISDLQNQILIETKDFKSGMYYVQLLNNNSNKVLKISVMK